MGFAAHRGVTRYKIPVPEKQKLGNHSRVKVTNSNSTRSRAPDGASELGFRYHADASRDLDTVLPESATRSSYRKMEKLTG